MFLIYPWTGQYVLTITTFPVPHLYSELSYRFSCSPTLIHKNLHHGLSHRTTTVLSMVLHRE